MKKLALVLSAFSLILFTGCDIEDIENITEADTEKFNYTVDSASLDQFGVSYYIEGTVENKKDKDYSYVQIEFICYDASGNNLGTALDNTNNLLGGQTWKFKAMFLGTGASTIDHCDYHEITGW